MHKIQGRQAAAIYNAIEDGTCNKVPSACFVNDHGDHILIDFYSCGGKIFRCEHDDRNCETRLEVLEGEEVQVFKDIYHIQ